MDQTASNIIDQQTALANFDHARDDFETAFQVAPDEALDYRPEGDDYTLAELLPYITGSITQYSRLIDQIKEAHFSEVHIEPPPRQDTLTGRSIDRQNLLLDLESAHDTLAGKLRDMLGDDFTRQAPVYFPGAPKPLPTSAADITARLTDYYNEHTRYVAQILEQHNSRS